MGAIERHWQRRGALAVALLPLAWLYCAVVWLRRRLYAAGLLRRVRLPAAVIVVGNLTVGGTGKTPLVIWLVHWLRRHGYHPGVVTRGYGGQAPSRPFEVKAHTDPALAGDEPLLLARRAHCPVVADPDRVRAARALIERHGCDVIVSDDGLQHYRLVRDIEIAVIDGLRRFGNGWCLPAGPLREPRARLRAATLVVTQGVPHAGELGMELAEADFESVHGEGRRPPDGFRGQAAHAVAGIGNPARFFAHLRRLGVEVTEHAFPDHHRFRPGDLAFGDDRPVLMTEKDAVKCERFAAAGWWYLAVQARPDPGLGERLLQLLKERPHG